MADPRLSNVGSGCGATVMAGPSYAPWIVGRCGIAQAQDGVIFHCSACDPNYVAMPGTVTINFNVVKNPSGNV